MQFNWCIVYAKLGKIQCGNFQKLLATEVIFQPQYIKYST